MLHWDIQKTQPLRIAKPLGKKPVALAHKKDTVFDAQKQKAIEAKVVPKVVPRPLINQNNCVLKTFNEDNQTCDLDDYKLEYQMPKTLVVFVAHFWTSDIDAYYTKLKNSCSESNIDLVILACGDRYESSEIIFRPSIDEVKAMYKDFHSKGLWACNHWILLWLWKFWAQEESYDFVWSIEYDVRTTGDLFTLWSMDKTYDYISSASAHNYTSEAFWGPNKSGFRPTHTALKQIFRCSANFLNYLHDQALIGQTGQDECTLATHAQKFKYRNLKEYLCSGYSPNKNDAVTRAWKLEKNNETKKLKIYHPIK